MNPTDSSGYLLVGVYDISVPAYLIVNASTTSSITDDLEVIKAALGGDDLIYGSGYADVLDGFGGNDEIGGFGGSDTIYGEAGDDFLDGGAGADILNGGTGLDVAQLQHLDRGGHCFSRQRYRLWR